MSSDAVPMTEEDYEDRSLYEDAPNSSRQDVFPVSVLTGITGTVPREDEEFLTVQKQAEHFRATEMTSTAVNGSNQVKVKLLFQKRPCYVNCGCHKKPIQILPLSHFIRRRRSDQSAYVSAPPKRFESPIKHLRPLSSSEASLGHYVMFRNSGQSGHSLPNMLPMPHKMSEMNKMEIPTPAYKLLPNKNMLQIVRSRKHSLKIVTEVPAAATFASSENRTDQNGNMSSYGIANDEIEMSNSLESRLHGLSLNNSMENSVLMQNTNFISQENVRGGPEKMKSLESKLLELSLERNERNEMSESMSEKKSDV